MYDLSMERRESNKENILGTDTWRPLSLCHFIDTRCWGRTCFKQIFGIRRCGVKCFVFIHQANIFQYLRDYFCYCHLGIRCIRIGLQNNSSHIVLCRKSIQLDAFLVPVPIDKPASRYFPILQVHLCFYLWGVRDTPQWKQGNTCTRSLPLTRPYRTGRFFCAFSRVWEWYFHLLKLFSGYCF